MRPAFALSGLPRQLCLLLAVLSLLAGCSVVGPSYISNGRLAYNEAIARTSSQQLLLAIVRNRYDEDVSLMSVSSVTANVKFGSSAGIQLGAGDSEAYAGNLVPFSAGGYYEENPTISYAPVAGSNYMHELASPLAVGSMAKLSASMSDPAPLLGMLVGSINGIHNPDFLYDGVRIDPRFDELLALLASLGKHHRLHWVADPNREGEFAIVIIDYADDYGAEVGALLALLKIDPPTPAGEDIVLPVSLAIHGRRTGSVAVTTRSILRLVEMFSAAVDVPREDLTRTQAYPPLGRLGDEIRIRYSSGRPESAFLAVRYREGWYYIEDHDLATKRYFRLLSVLWNVAIGEGAATSNAPVLTVPVSG